MIGCAKGIFAKGLLGGTGFSLLWWEKGLRLPFSHRKRSLRPFFLPQKGEPRTSQNPLSENPLSATHEFSPSLIHGLCAFFDSNSRFMRLFQAALDASLDSPFFASLSVHGLHFTVYAPSTSMQPIFDFNPCVSIKKDIERRVFELRLDSNHRRCQKNI